VDLGLLHDLLGGRFGTHGVDGTGGRADKDDAGAFAGECELGVF
jgi:hypothetical protein